MRGRRVLAIVVGVVGLILLLLIVVWALTNPSSPTAPPAANGEVSEGNGQTGGGITLPFQPGPTVDPSAQLVEVVVSLQTVPRGWQMTANELFTDLRIAEDVGSNVVTRIEDVVGLYARRDIFQGETLTVDMVARDPRQIGRENYGPSSLIPPGWIAQAVPIDRLSSVAFGMLPGDSVDVLASFVLIDVDEEFQSILDNSVSFMLEQTDEEGNIFRTVFVVDPYGRFEQLDNNDLVHVLPSEPRRPILVVMALQNAKVISLGAWSPPGPAEPPTPVPDDLDNVEVDDEQTPPTATPPPPDVLLLAMPAQQQLILRYALDSNAPIMVGLRGVNDGQLYGAEGVNLEYLLRQYNFQPPPDFNFSLYGIGASSSD